MDASASPPRSQRADRRGTTPERLTYLFETIHKAGRRPYSAAEVARWINENGGNISSVYILKILKGERTEVSQPYLRSLAQFFGVPAAFFWEENPAEVDGETLSGAIALRNKQLQDMLTRAARLSPRSQDALSDIIDGLLRAEGKDA